jgi:hypothetical protein
MGWRRCEAAKQRMSSRGHDRPRLLIAQGVDVGLPAAPDPRLRGAGRRDQGRTDGDVDGPGYGPVGGRGSRVGPDGIGWNRTGNGER